MKQKRIVPYPFNNNNTDNPLLSENKLLNIFLGKPFWIWDKQKHDLDFLIDKNCCFNHIIGLPVKNDKTYPLFDYEKLIFDTIENNQNIWILKSRGIGVTTFMIRYFAWKILNSSELDRKSIFIVSGTREEHANYIKEKLQQLFENFIPVRLESKYTELWLKKTWIKVFPTKNIKDIRGYFETSYIFVDESNYLEESIQDELIHAISPYEEKSNCKIILCSTPNRPGGLMQRIENDPNSKYYKLKLNYTYGLDKIYNRTFIEKKKLEPEFEREYNLKYLGKIGNVFNPLQIDECIQLAEPLQDIQISNYNLHSVGVDFGFSSSKTAIVMTEHLKIEGEDKIIVRFAEEYDKANPQTIVDICHSLCRKHWNTLFYVDGANRGAVNLMKVAFDESLDWDTKEVSPELMKIIPVNFMTEHKQMLSHLHVMVNKGYLAIPEKYDRLITSLRTAWAEELTLDKQQTSYDDLLDALRLSLKGYNIK